jgi:hypothetical protein
VTGPQIAAVVIAILPLGAFALAMLVAGALCKHHRAVGLAIATAASFWLASSPIGKAAWSWASAVAIAVTGLRGHP